MSSGFLYVLQNNSHGPYVVKVGLTTRSPDVRTKEIYSGQTGVPEPFDIAAAFSVGDCESAEKEVHQRLSTFRINPKREFFRITPKIACTIAYETCGKINERMGIGPPEPYQIVKKDTAPKKAAISPWFDIEDLSKISIEYRELSELKMAPVGTSTLTEGQLDRAKILQMIFMGVLPKIVEQWHEEFSRDLILEPEIQVWEKIAKVFLEIDQIDVINDEWKKEAFGIILSASLIPANQVLDGLDFKHLSTKAATQILALCK